VVSFKDDMSICGFLYMYNNNGYMALYPTLGQGKCVKMNEMSIVSPLLYKTSIMICAEITLRKMVMG